MPLLGLYDLCLNALFCTISWMRLRLGKFILLAMTILMLYILLVNGFPVFMKFFKRPDGIHPNPVVELQIECADGSYMIVRGNSSRTPCMVKRVFQLIVILLNNSSEPSVRDVETASGALIVLDGGRITGYELEGFNSIIGVTEEGELVNPIGSRIIEVLSRHIDGWAKKVVKLNVTVNEDTSIIQIRFRGWIIDEDDEVWNPVDKNKEHYYARDPPEDPVENPPDSRWSGRDFLRYKTYTFQVQVIR